MLTYFANMVKTNQIKIRSKRVISELDTWIYKGTAARIDHQDGCHDDTLTCLAMAVFVMSFSMKKIVEAKEKGKVMLKAWTNTATLTGSTHDITVKHSTEIYATPKKNYSMPIYNNKTLSKTNNYPYRWLIL
jgi:hypothetical protein